MKVEPGGKAIFKFLVASLNLILYSFLLFACSSAATPAAPTQVSAAPQVLVQGNTLAEETQTIELDNCDGKADAVRSEQRGQSVDVTVSAEVAAKLGVSAQVIEAEVQATVGAQVTDSGYRSSTIQLVAPPKTRMVFQIVWSGPEQVGIVQNLQSVGIPIAFRRFSPTDVKIKSQIDVGCANLGATSQQSSSTTIPQVATIPSQPTQPPVIVNQPTAFPTRTRTERICPVAITRAQVESWHVGETDVPTVKSYVKRADDMRVNDVGSYARETLLPTSVLIETNLDETDGTRWQAFPVIPIVHSGSFGLFETTAEFIAPNTGACLRIVQ